MREGVEEDNAGEPHAFGSGSSVLFLTKRGIWLFSLLCECEPQFTYLFSVSLVPYSMWWCPYQENFLKLVKLNNMRVYVFFLILNFKFTHTHIHPYAHHTIVLWLMEDWMKEIVAIRGDLYIFPNCAIYKCILV